MTKNKFIIILLFFNNLTFGQSFINGDFEINLAQIDQINISNDSFNYFMPNCTASGWSGNMDIITSSDYSGGASSGDWFVALTAGESDLLAIELSSPIIMGNHYTISFYDKKDSLYPAQSVEIGLSTTNISFGYLVYSCNDVPINATWTNRTFSFIAPSTGTFITVRLKGNGMGYWSHVDDFSLLESQNPNFEMPNVFTPNNDGVNDKFAPINNVEYSNGELLIYNRWGEKMFFTNDLKLGWNGTYNGSNCTDGTYFWSLNYTNKFKEKCEESGFLTLVNSK